MLIQNALKAYVYLITSFMSDYVKSKDAKSELKVSRGKKKQLTATQSEIKEIIQLSKDCLQQFSKIIDMKIHFLWPCLILRPEHRIDEAFINLLSNKRENIDIVQRTSGS